MSVLSLLTLDERGGFEICPVCFWEDDGQDDHDADVVRGGPNAELSLTEARENYAQFGATARRTFATSGLRGWTKRQTGPANITRATVGRRYLLPFKHSASAADARRSTSSWLKNRSPGAGKRAVLAERVRRTHRAAFLEASHRCRARGRASSSVANQLSRTSQYPPLLRTGRAGVGNVRRRPRLVSRQQPKLAARHTARRCVSRR